MRTKPVDTISIYLLFVWYPKRFKKKISRMSFEIFPTFWTSTYLRFDLFFRQRKDHIKYGKKIHRQKSKIVSSFNQSNKIIDLFLLLFSSRHCSNSYLFPLHLVFYSLQVLSLGGNLLNDVPEAVGNLHNLQALTLCDNIIENLPMSIARLSKLRSLLLHKNRLRHLPRDIITLKNLVEVIKIKYFVMNVYLVLFKIFVAFAIRLAFKLFFI